MQVTEAAKGQMSFFRTNNGGYGTNWEAGRTDDPAEVPQYRELVSLWRHYESSTDWLMFRNIWNGLANLNSILWLGREGLGAEEFAEDV